MTNQRFITILGYVATFTSVCMYVSYLQQIGLNLSGQKGGWLQPFATTMHKRQILPRHRCSCLRLHIPRNRH